MTVLIEGIVPEDSKPQGSKLKRDIVIMSFTHKESAVKKLFTIKGPGKSAMSDEIVRNTIEAGIKAKGPQTFKLVVSYNYQFIKC